MLRDRLSLTQKFKINRILLDSGVGDYYMRSRSPYRKYRPLPTSSFVIDGFPRSANTYAYFAAQAVLERGQVKGHTHSSATLRRAVRLSVPCLLIVRNPDDAVSSLVQMVDGLPVHTAFWAYARFHARLREQMASIYVASFEEVIDDFGAVMERVNVKFGSSLAVYRKTHESELAIRSRIDRANASYHQGTIREAGVARPSKRRRQSKEVLQDLDSNSERWRTAAYREYSGMKTG